MVLTYFSMANELSSFVASIVTRRHRAARTLFHYLEPIVSERLANRAAPDKCGNSESVPVCWTCRLFLIYAQAEITLS